MWLVKMALDNRVVIRWHGKTLAVVISLAFTNGAMAQDCDRNSFVQSSMNACAHLDWQTADKELNRVYKQAKAVALRMDEYLEYGQVPAANMLRNAQRAWIPFRDLACDAESVAMRGGSAQPLLYWGCMTRLTRQRTEDLQYFTDVN